MPPKTWLFFFEDVIILKDLVIVFQEEKAHTHKTNNQVRKAKEKVIDSYGEGYAMQFYYPLEMKSKSLRNSIPMPATQSKSFWPQ